MANHDSLTGLRQSDILCRWGGEAFIVLLREAEGRQAIEVAEKIRRRTDRALYRAKQAGRNRVCRETP